MSVHISQYLLTVFCKSVAFYNVVCLLVSMWCQQWFRVKDVFKDPQNKCDNCMTFYPKSDNSLARNFLASVYLNIFLKSS